MSLAKMTMHRVKKVIAWVLAIGVIGLIVLGIIYLMESGV